MDPLTILTSVDTARKFISSVSSALYKFIQAMKQVDKTVETLFGEVGTQGRSIDAIDSVLQQPSAQAIIRDDLDSDLWKSVDGSLVECRKTLESLETLSVDLEAKKDRKLFGKAIKQIKVNWRLEDFGTLRQHLHSHGLAMQLTLQTINVYVYLS
jgi:hypothetical protein